MIYPQPSEYLTYREAIVLLELSIGNTSIPYFVVGSQDPSKFYLAMWSNEIIEAEIVDLADEIDEELEDSEDSGITFCFDEDDE